MGKSYLWKVFLIECAVYLSVDGRSVDAGLCDDLIHNCRCGVPPNDHQFQLKFKQCSYSGERKLECKPCNGENPQVECARYSQCQECHKDVNGCISCPIGKYGHWCNGDCKCQNGGTCNRNDGGCACPPTFAGTFCENRLMCGPPEIIAGLTWDGESRKVGDVIVARCKPGSTLIVPKSRTCSVNGSWVPEPPLCESTCSFPSLGPHVRSQVNPGITSKLFSADNKEIIKKIDFRCDPGYTLVGAHRLQCQPDGVWDMDPPKCELITITTICKDPGTPLNGNRIVIDSIDGAFAPGTIIKFTCNQGHFLSGSEIITCISSGNWSNSIPQCHQVSGCPPPEFLENGNVEVTKQVSKPPKIVPGVSRVEDVFQKGRQNRTSTTPKPVQSVAPNIPPGFSGTDSKALYSCKTIYYRLVGTSTRICLENGVWSGKQPVCKPLCGQSHDIKRPSIINGTTSVLGKWPWHAAIFAPATDLNETNRSLGCGGSLVNENWVITAAHCVTEDRLSIARDIKVFRVYLGKHFRDTSMDDSEVKVFAVKNIIVHPNFHPGSLDSDIALMELMEPATFSSRIQPICLPHKLEFNLINVLEDNLPTARTGIATGWGTTKDGRFATALQETELGVVNRTFCEVEYRLRGHTISLTANMFCAGWEKGGTGTCSGDSGGPFVAEELDDELVAGPKRKRWVLQGIISWGADNECALAHEYGGLLTVAKFVPWIEQFI